jgi:hypothetical protein
MLASEMDVVRPSRFIGPMTAAIALLAASVAPMAWIEAQPRDAGTVAAVYPPWFDADRTIRRAAEAGGAVVRFGAIGAIVVVHDDKPGLSDRLRASGAWFVLDPQFLGGCLSLGT